VTKSDQRRLATLLAVLAGVSAFAFWPRATVPVSARARAVPAERRGASRSGPAAVYAPEQVPTLGPLEPRSVGSVPVERNIFNFPAPTKTRVPTPAPPTPTPIPVPGSARFIGPMQPPPPPTPTPIIPPPIPYKLVGLFGPLERPIAAFEDNGRLINAREGDVLDGRFIVRKVNKESVDFAFVGLPKDITRRLAMTTEAAR
jgi:hypothetical protein